MDIKKFPADFLWGVSASACQIEGAAFEDGKSANVHDFVLRDPVLKEKYKGKRLPDVCADFYHKYPEDIARFQELGVNTFRYSISWARIYPDGPERVNKQGIAFYNALIDALLAAGITPFLDLLHADIPQWVLERDGYLNRDFIKWFAAYAKTCFEAFGDRVKLWSTVNEPKLNVYGVYAHAFAYPFVNDERSAMRATRNMLLAHYEAVKLCRRICPDAHVGSVNNYGKTYPHTFEPQEIHAAKMHDMLQHLFVHPMQYGRYPQLLLEDAEFSQYVTEEDKKELAAAFVPADFAGINYYTPCFTSYDATKKYGIGGAAPNRLVEADGYGFMSYPRGLFDTLMDISELYPGLPLYISENGYTTLRGGELDEPTGTDDFNRINYVREHILEAWNAIQMGVNLKGYYYWAAMDCFECSLGFGIDMGLLGINFGTLERTVRDSFYFYRDVIKHNGTI